jgi:hypothetical protein
MIAAFLLAASPIATAIDAEYAFANDAQRIGQWTAFRKWADKDAVMFTPQAVWARDFLKDRKDPPKAIRWIPAQSFVSCDGRTAVNTGPWFSAEGKPAGYFTTVWQRDKDKWRWAYDGGGPLKDVPPLGRYPVVHRAACGNPAPGAPIAPPPPLTPAQSLKTAMDNGRGESADKTLGWDWKVDKKGGRIFRVYLWEGRRYAQVLYNDVPPPKAK